jgi:hypothetical protein
MRLRRRWFRSLVWAFVLLVWVTRPSHALDESAAEGGPATAPSELPELQDKDLRAKEEALKALPEHGEYTIIPIPAFAYSRNERYWIGGLVPILQSNQKGELQNIIAPQYLHNQYIGETGTLNYYGYPSDTAQYSAILSYSTKIERDFEFNYKNVAALYCRDAVSILQECLSPLLRLRQ